MNTNENTMVDKSKGYSPIRFFKPPPPRVEGEPYCPIRILDEFYDTPQVEFSADGMPLLNKEHAPGVPALAPSVNKPKVKAPEPSPENDSEYITPTFCNAAEMTAVSETAPAVAVSAPPSWSAPLPGQISQIGQLATCAIQSMPSHAGFGPRDTNPGQGRITQTPAVQTQRVLTPLPADKVKAYDVAAELCSRLPMAMVNEALFVYNGRAYEFVSAEKMNRLIMAHCRSYVRAVGNATLIKQIYDVLKSEPSICRDDHRQEDLVSLDNGLLNLRGLSIVAHTPETFVTAQILGQFRPDLNLACPQFDRFLDTIAQGDPELIQRLWEVVGYLLVPDGRGKAAIVFQGVRDSGKSLLGDLIASFFPTSLVTSLSMDDMGERFGPAELVGKSLCTSMDLSAGLWDARATGVLKTLTGGDMLTADVKYQARIRFRNTAKLLFGTNHAIASKTRDDALMRRLVVVPFRQSIPLDAQDHDLKAKLLSERDAIITKALVAYRGLRQRNYRFTGEYQLNETIASGDTEFSPWFNLDQAVADFFERCCAIRADALTFTDDLYAAFLSVSPGAQGNVTISTFSGKLSRYLEVSHPGGWSKCRERKPNRANPQSGYQGVALI